MSETVIVNRISATWGQEQERKRLESETPVEKPGVIPTQAGPETSKAQNLHIEDSKAIEESEKPPDTIHSPAADLISRLLKEKASDYARTEFLAFKDQVIRAFRHLGLDTRKHFGV